MEEGYKYEDLVRPTYSSLIIRSKGMKPRNMIAYWMLQVTLGFPDKHSLTFISIKDPLSLEGKVESKYSSSSSFRIVKWHNIYPSWININLSVFFLKTYQNFYK